MFSVKCAKRVCSGLFSIDEGTRWNIKGIKYDADIKKSMVFIDEKDQTDAWGEIPQNILAECFKAE